MTFNNMFTCTGFACALLTAVPGFADDGDDDDEVPGYDIITVAIPVVISWPAVTRTHPDLGYPQDSRDIAIYNYEVVVEADIELPGGDEFATVFSTIVPPGVTSVTIRDEFLSQSDEFKFEVLAREESWNQTAVECCFLIDAGG